ncbi:MAG: helix-turn-helix domain-containing protein [Phycisphaerae bacterium]
MTLPQKEDLGFRVQMLRKRCGLSLRQVATLAGVTAGMISCVERNKTSPSLGMLRKILEALGSDLGTFFGSGEGKQDGPAFLREGMRVVTDKERKYTMIFPRRKDIGIQMFDEHYSFNSHKPPFEKLKCTVSGYILCGSLVLEVKGQPPKTLRPGDAFYIPPGVEHRGFTHTDEPVRLISVYSPAVY